MAGIFVFLAMQFANPLFLFALAALAIPILIHLFNFRRYKKIWFTNVRFLRELQQETKKQSKLRQLLILISRLLAVASLVFAFAQPFLPSSRLQKDISGQRAVSVYLDNSFSMEAVATDGKLIEIARSRAREIASAYTPSDLFQLLTNDFEGKHQRFVSRDEFLKLVEEVKISPVSRPVREVITRQNDLLGEHPEKVREAYLVSDFQKNTAELASSRPDSATTWFLLPLTAVKQDNLFVDSIHFLSPVHQPGQPVGLKVYIRNTSGSSLEKIPVKLTLNSVQKALASFNVDANATVAVTLAYTENAPGIQSGLVEITDYPIVHDDRFYFSYEVLPSIQVQAIHDQNPNPYLDALFGNDSSVRFFNTQVRQLDYATLFSRSLIILNGPATVSSGLVQELNRYVTGGGHLVIFPPDAGSAASYTELLAAFNLPPFGTTDTIRQRIMKLNQESFLYHDVFEKNAAGRVALPENIDLPMVSKYYRLESGARSTAEPLLSLQNGLPFLLTAPAGRGRVYLFASPLHAAWSLFPRHMIFVPTLYKMALLSNPSYPLWHMAGDNARIDLSADSVTETNLYRIRKMGSGYEMIPEVRKLGANVTLLTHGQIADDGHFTILRGPDPVRGIAFNYDRRESDLSCFTTSELEKQISRLPAKDIFLLKEKKASVVKEIRQINQGTPLWKWFIIATLVFLACEIAIIRLFRV